MSVTPHDIRNKIFTTVRWRSGYEQAEVDEFLDALEGELNTLLEGSAPAAASPRSGTAEEALVARLEAPGHMLSRVHMREGYDVTEVDAFLADVAAAFAEVRARA